MPNNLQLLIVAALLGFSALSWVVRKLKAQAEIAERRRAAERLELERLRTGRGPATPERAPRDLPGPMTAGAQSEEERRARLAELRRQQLERLRRQAAQGGGGIILQIPGTSGPIVIAPAPPRGAGSGTRGAGTAPSPAGGAGARSGARQPARATGRPQPRPGARPPARGVGGVRGGVGGGGAGGRDGRQRAARPVSSPDEAPGMAEELEDRQRAEAIKASRVAAEREAMEAEARRQRLEELRTRERRVSAGMPASEWRRAIILGEILGPPVSLRD